MSIITEEILLVEDETIIRDGLTRLLKNRGYQVSSASTGPQAIVEAKRGGARVVLMDIALQGELDGIEIAEEIQEIHPLTSFIFVSAYANDPKNLERACEKRIRVGGWIEKPYKIDNVVEMIDYEQRKLEVLASLHLVEENGGNPYEYIRSQETSLPPRLVEDLFAEYELRPLVPGEKSPDMKAIAHEIDDVYDQIRALIRERGDDSDLKEAARPLRERLRVLQRQEAHAIELYVRSRLLFDPRKGRELLDRAERLLRDR